MKETRTDIMGMPITVEIAEPFATEDDLDNIFAYFRSIDDRFSPFKENSELGRINRREISVAEYSPEMTTVLKLAEETKRDTDGYFDVFHNGRLNPSGLVKGWAIWQAAQNLRLAGFRNFYINAGGDIEAAGSNGYGQQWRVGIASPFKEGEIVKAVYLSDRGIATSGTYRRGAHIYDPHYPRRPIDGIVSLTVIGPDIYEADRFATACFAMGRAGIDFIEREPGLEGYLIDQDGQAIYTSGFGEYTKQ
jgi:thiamine biosynthesis lipoprotein